MDKSVELCIKRYDACLGEDGDDDIVMVSEDGKIQGTIDNKSRSELIYDVILLRISLYNIDFDSVLNGMIIMGLFQWDWEIYLENKFVKNAVGHYGPNFALIN